MVIKLYHCLFVFIFITRNKKYTENLRFFDIFCDIDIKNKCNEYK